ncbi:MAG: hypothetical protein JKX68_13970 [Flavobacteriales bacterium]|nr:hypothetical protein [Flavobacteriales bacterium]
MKSFFKYISFLAIGSFILFSCSKTEEREGCTDIKALNFSSLAKIDDGSCEYLDSSFTIWENGDVGFWGDEITGTFIVKSCFTDTFTVFLNPDTTFVAPDTIITTNPPDTTYVPADTLITGDTYLLINSDASGNYELIIQLLNKKNANDFKNGYLIFNAKLHPDASINNFDIFIHGNHLNSGGINCSTFLQSDPVVLSSSSLDTNSFKEISIPLTSFTNRYMQDIDLVFGIKGTNAMPNTNLILISSVKWVTVEEE